MHVPPAPSPPNIALDVKHLNVGDLTSLLIAATKTGNIRTVELLLKNGADVNENGLMDMTPLHLAVRMNNTKLAKVLLENKADPKAANALGQTPLFLASSMGKADMVEILLNAGATAKTPKKTPGAVLLTQKSNRSS